MKKILVATDFSPAAATAMKYALGLAKTAGAAVDVLHVIYPAEGIDSSVYTVHIMADYIEARKEFLQSWVAAYRKTNAGVKITATHLVGYMPYAVADYAAQKKVDLLILGTSGATGIAGVLGSNAASVVSKTKLPALLVPAGAKYKAKARMVFATDFQLELSADSRKVFKQLVSAHGCQKMDVIHVMPPSQKKPALDKQAQFVRALGVDTLEFHYAHAKDPVTAIHTFVEATSADILCTVSHSHNAFYHLFQRSKSKKMANQALRAVLVLHD